MQMAACEESTYICALPYTHGDHAACDIGRALLKAYR